MSDSRGGKERTEVVVIAVLVVDGLRPVLAVAVDAVYGGLLVEVVVVDAREVVEVPFEGAVLRGCWERKENKKSARTLSPRPGKSKPVQPYFECKVGQREGKEGRTSMSCKSETSLLRSSLSTSVTANVSFLSAPNLPGQE